MKTYIPVLFPFILLLTEFKTGIAQIIGGNGEGLTTIISDNDIPQLQLLNATHPIAIRWPGGGDSKLAFPALDKPGLGMNKDSIEKLYIEFTDPKDRVKQDKLEKDLKQADNDALRPRSAILELIDLSHKLKNLQVDYCLNVLQGNVESNISAIQTLIDSGVNIISIVAGNETFYSYKYDFEAYRRDFEPIFEVCEKKWPAIRRLLCIGQELGKADHIKWNNALIKYVNETGDLISGVDVHYYLFNELKDANALHPKSVVYRSDSTYQTLDAAFEKYILLTKADKGLDEYVAYLKKNLPGKIYHCTEFGDKQAEYWSNTIANAGHIFDIFCTYRNDFQILLVQNFIANWYWAARRPAGKLDANPEGLEKINRCHWYAIQLANELPYETPRLNDKTELNMAGTYYFYFNHSGEEKMLPEFAFKNCKMITCEIHYLSGNHTYSSAGQTGFMAKNSQKTLEVQGIDVISGNSIMEIPANAFGYIKIITE